MIHQFLSTQSYWAQGIPRAVVVRSLENALCFGLFRAQKQIGFGRVITDRATFAYLADVFVLTADRGKGLGKWLVERILSHPDLPGLRRWMLATGDAHGLYKQFGFTLSQPGLLMQKVNPQVYRHIAAETDTTKSPL
ncbi:MAG: GNAT family N-acetyltransferase [Cyanobacteria bacterium P01_D01_bin.115]